MEEKITITMSRERPGRKPVPIEVTHHTDLINGIMSKVKPILTRLGELEEREQLLKDELEPLYCLYSGMAQYDPETLVEAHDLLDEVFELLWQLGYVK